MDYQTILEHAPLPILIYQDGKLVYSNPAGYEIFAQSGFVVTPDDLPRFDQWGRVSPEQALQTEQAIRRVISEQRPLHNLPVTSEDASGTPISILVSAAPTVFARRPAATLSFVIIGLYPERGGNPATPDLRFHDARHQRLEGLTAREREVALLVAEGQRTAAIALALGIQDSTLRSHLKAIYRKTGTHSRTELTRLVMGHR